MGLSGGVDSSVAAWLLQEAGHEVEALFLINWKDSSVTLSGDCSWEEDLIVARLVAKKLDIPLHVVDYSRQYMERVAEYMFREYEKGRTPNPDILCNREIKFDAFIRAADEHGASYYATGHYCRKEETASGGRTVYRLLAGTDKNKDQSYFLCRLSQEQLSRALFPIGGLTKARVRLTAARLGLPTADRKDSQGLCFVGKVDLPVFLRQRLQPKEGAIIEIPAEAVSITKTVANDLPPDDELRKLTATPVYRAGQGRVVGRHPGAHYFTIGQRKGMNLGGMKKPPFIIATDIRENIVYVGQGQDHPGLHRMGLFVPATDVHWVRPDLTMSPGTQAHYLVRIRYRQPLQEATLYFRQEGVYMIFREPQRGITPGQFAAWYLGEELMGSGEIA
ncbi:MAG: tRNA 2-thiouridine(34) synthase MnmA [Bacteroidales bacterium]|nr:tRNA 2-thiouridine(34) synthase MnmA [Bacteroidales bacterium]